jgi:hypothetical protein
MKEPVITHENIIDSIVLDGKYNFSSSVTIGLSDGGDFYLVLDFSNLSTEEYKTLVKLNELKREIEFKSKLVEKENYNITHIVIKKFTGNNQGQIRMECSSDEPDYGLEIL